MIFSHRNYSQIARNCFLLFGIELLDVYSKLTEWEKNRISFLPVICAVDNHDFDSRCVADIEVDILLL